MKIRKLEKKEHGQTRKLYETVFFQDEACFVDYYYQNKIRDNEIYAAEDENGIHSMLHLNPVQVNWHGKLETISYIVAVATEEKYRHRGLMRQILECSLNNLYEQRTPFVFLMPASEAIYTPFGFRRAWEWQWEEETVLSKRKAEIGRLERKDPEQCSQQEIEQLCRNVNEILSKKYELFSQRSPEYYQNLDREQKASGGQLDILFECGVPVSACCRAKEKFPPMMTRIIHLEQFVSRLRSKEEKIYYWQVTDGLLPENNGLFQVILTPLGGNVRRLAAGSLGIQPIVDNVDVSEIPGLLGENNPFYNAFVCEVV